MEATINRRNFLKAGAALGTAGVLAGLVGCSPEPLSQTGGTDQSQTPAAPVADETVSCDIVVVGGGLAGLAAAVQAAEDGAQTILLEAGQALGGNGSGVEGILGVNSSMQKKQGIEFSIADVIREEVGYTKGRNECLRWKDLLDASADNIDWLIGHGVEFSGVIDNYKNMGNFPTFHWFKGERAQYGYVDQMGAAAEGLGVDIRCSNVAKTLSVEDGTVTGVYAETDGKTVRYEAKAVILATGGYGGNTDYLLPRGYNPDDLFTFGAPFHDGDGYRMALEAGGADRANEVCALESFSVGDIVDQESIWHGGNAIAMLASCAATLWVNQDGERYTYEDCATENNFAQMMPSFNQEFTCGIIDQGVFDAMSQAYIDLGIFPEKTLDECHADLNDYVDRFGGSEVVKADTPEALAEEASRVLGLDQQTLLDSLNHYNEMCLAGKDSDFGKDSASMIPLLTPPYYCYRFKQGCAVAIGGVHTSRSMEVLTEEDEAIPGLYCAGVDGVELYRHIYTICIGGSCNANNVHSGRVAAHEAAAYAKSL